METADTFSLILGISLVIISVVTCLSIKKKRQSMAAEVSTTDPEVPNKKYLEYRDEMFRAKIEHFIADATETILAATKIESGSGEFIYHSATNSYHKFISGLKGEIIFFFNFWQINNFSGLRPEIYDTIRGRLEEEVTKAGFKLLEDLTKSERELYVGLFSNQSLPPMILVVKEKETPLNKSALETLSFAQILESRQLIQGSYCDWLFNVLVLTSLEDWLPYAKEKIISAVEKGDNIRIPSSLIAEDVSISLILEPNKVALEVSLDLERKNILLAHVKDINYSLTSLIVPINAFFAKVTDCFADPKDFPFIPEETSIFWLGSPGLAKSKIFINLNVKSGEQE